MSMRNIKKSVISIFDIWKPSIAGRTARNVNYLKLREPQSIIWKLNFKILIYSVKDYVRHYAKREGEKLGTLSEYVKFCEVVDTNSQNKKGQNTRNRS